MTDYRAELQRLVQAYDEHGGKWPDENEQALFQAVEAARTALAQPEPEGEAGELVKDLRECADSCTLAEKHGWARVMRRAAEVLARWGRPTIKPVPVAERPWERECGWLDLDGECWRSPPEGPAYWQMANPAMVYGGWLLPARAMPIPTTH